MQSPSRRGTIQSVFLHGSESSAQERGGNYYYPPRPSTIVQSKAREFSPTSPEEEQLTNYELKVSKFSVFLYLIIMTFFLFFRNYPPLNTWTPRELFHGSFFVWFTTLVAMPLIHYIELHLDPLTEQPRGRRTNSGYVRGRVSRIRGCFKDADDALFDFLPSWARTIIHVLLFIFSIAFILYITWVNYLFPLQILGFLAICYSILLGLRIISIIINIIITLIGLFIVVAMAFRIGDSVCRNIEFLFGSLLSREAVDLFFIAFTTLLIALFLAIFAKIHLPDRVTALMKHLTPKRTHGSIKGVIADRYIAMNSDVEGNDVNSISGNLNVVTRTEATIYIVLSSLIIFVLICIFRPFLHVFRIPLVLAVRIFSR